MGPIEIWDSSSHIKPPWYFAVPNFHGQFFHLSLGLNSPLQSCVWTMEIEHRKILFCSFSQIYYSSAIYRTISNWQFGVLFSQKWVLQSVVECVRWLTANACEVLFLKSLDFQLWKLKLRGNKNFFFLFNLLEWIEVLNCVKIEGG